jgi:hypothetical protein
MVANASRRLTAATVQRSLAILDVVFPAGFGVAEQMQPLHDQPPGESEAASLHELLCRAMCGGWAGPQPHHAAKVA